MARSVAFGAEFGRAILAWAAKDGFLEARGKEFVTGINVTKPVEPYWGQLRPFALETADSCQAPLPVPFSTSPGSAFYAQAKTVYDVGLSLTPEQRKIGSSGPTTPANRERRRGTGLGSSVNSR